MIKNLFVSTLSAFLGLGSLLPCVPPIINISLEQHYCDDTYSGYGSAESHTDVIEFDSYETTTAQVDYLLPSYFGSYGSNACAPTAGSITVGYYDVYYPNLLPDYDTIYYYNGYNFRSQDSTINALQETLYNLMGTNTTGTGTTATQFKTGLAQYFSNQGYSLGYNNVTSNITPSYVKSYYELEKPIILFLTSYDYFPEIGLTLTSDSFSMVGYRKTAGHVCVAGAYQQFKFYQDGSLYRTDEYLYVSWGDGTCGYISINDTSYIQEAYTLNVS